MVIHHGSHYDKDFVLLHTRTDDVCGTNTFILVCVILCLFFFQGSVESNRYDRCRQSNRRVAVVGDALCRGQGFFCFFAFALVPEKNPITIVSGGTGLGVFTFKCIGSSLVNAQTRSGSRVINILFILSGTTRKPDGLQLIVRQRIYHKQYLSV